MNFYTVVESAGRYREVAIGYRLENLADNKFESYGVKLNLQKSKMITFTEHDKIIVLFYSS